METEPFIELIQSSYLNYPQIFYLREAAPPPPRIPKPNKNPSQ